MIDDAYTVGGVVGAVSPTLPGESWKVRLCTGGTPGGTPIPADDDPWFTVRRSDLPVSIDEPRVGDIVTVTVPRLQSLQRVTAGKVVGGPARRVGEQA